MTPLESQPQGTRIASIHNGSSLFTGDAGQGESDTRRYLLENDLVESIVQLAQVQELELTHPNT